MYYSVVSAEHIAGYRLRVGFEDGNSGVVDLEPYAKKGGVFSGLADPVFFKRFEINRDFGALCWGDEVDIAPESLYRKVVGDIASTKVAEDRARYGSDR